MVMPVSVPVRTKETLAASKSRQRKGIAPLPAVRGTLLYRSLMLMEEEREEEEEEGGGHYRPPPMLCPLRAGPGLYCCLSPVRLRAETVQLHSKLCEKHCQPSDTECVELSFADFILQKDYCDLKTTAGLNKKGFNTKSRPLTPHILKN